jgi:molybdopterin molybdotransferase
VFGLPGNPVSTLVCFYLYARPAILKMSGRRRVGLPRVQARCAVDIKLSRDLTEFVRVKLEHAGAPAADAEGWRATPTGSQGSGILSSLSRADGLLIGPSTETILKAGAQATVLLLGPGVEVGAVTADELFEGRRHNH